MHAKKHIDIKLDINNTRILRADWTKSLNPPKEKTTALDSPIFNLSDYPSNLNWAPFKKQGRTHKQRVYDS